VPRGKEQAKNYLFRLEYLALLNIMPSFSLTILFLHDFRLEHNIQWLSQILPILRQLVRFSPSHLLFILSSAFISHWPIAEEALTNQAMGSSAPTQDLAPASPRAQLASPQLEFQCHQIIQLPLNQLYKNSLPSLKNLLLLLGKPEMM
jgi:hypothetical protein